MSDIYIQLIKIESENSGILKSGSALLHINAENTRLPNIIT